MKKVNLILKVGIICCVLALVTACTPAPPTNITNACEIFTQYPDWFWAAQKSEQEWGVPIYVQLAIIFQESSFKGKAAPPRGKFFWVLPGKRPTSAYGYSQAVNQTWLNYCKQTGNSSGSRNRFTDASDFIGWYGWQAYKKLGIPENNAYDLYLAYHEGLGGYAKGSYNNKPWLMTTAKKVQANANRYQGQLKQCADKFRKPWWHIW